MNAYDTKYCPDELKGVRDFTPTGWRNEFALYSLAATIAGHSLWAEFGVGAGRSTRDLLRLLDKAGRMFLFDSWLGIPTDWLMGDGAHFRKGEWRFEKLKVVDRRVSFVDGWFKDTLPYKFGEQIGLAHLDCDVYESARDVLFGIDEWIAPGTVLIFDELIGYERFADHEYRALCEWRDATGKSVRWLAKERFGAIGVVS